MTKAGVEELYMWLSTAWPLVVKPGAAENWKAAKMRELYDTYSQDDDALVLEAFQKWTEENEKFPTTRNIKNEIAWLRVKKGGKTVDPTKRYVMERIYDDGTEYMVMVNGKTAFSWQEFINLPCNPEHLDPEEWERRFKARRKLVLRKLSERLHSNPEDTYREDFGGASNE